MQYLIGFLKVMIIKQQEVYIFEGNVFVKDLVER